MAQGEEKAGPFIGCGLRPYPSFMALDDPLDGSQTDAGAGKFADAVQAVEG